MENKFKSDPENYNKLSEPFETKDEAVNACEEFCKEVSELRKKHKIADVLIRFRTKRTRTKGND